MVVKLEIKLLVSYDTGESGVLHLPMAIGCGHHTDAKHGVGVSIDCIQQTGRIHAKSRTLAIM